MPTVRLAAGDDDQFPLFVGRLIPKLSHNFLDLRARVQAPHFGNWQSTLKVCCGFDYPEAFELFDRPQYGLPACDVVQAFEGTEWLAASIVGELTNTPPLSITKRHQRQRLSPFIGNIPRIERCRGILILPWERPPF